MSDPFPEDPFYDDRGRLINRRAALGSQIVSMRAQIPELTKLARSTPPKTLTREWEKVKLAQQQLPVVQKRLAECELEWMGLKTRLTLLGAYGKVTEK